MPDFNTVIIAGRLTQEPDCRYTTNGTAITEINLAVNRRAGEKNETLFISCVCFGKTAENVRRYMQKGSSILISGFLRQESWTTRDGAKRSTIKVVCDTVQFLDRRPDNPPVNPPPYRNCAPTPEQPDLPQQTPQIGHRYTRADIPPEMNPAPAQEDPHVENVENVNVDDIPF